MAMVKLPYPRELTGDLREDVAELNSKVSRIVKELEFLLNNLDEMNVLKAASVNASDINTSKALIQDAQIQNIKADKIDAGTINSELVSIKSKNSALEIAGQEITLRDLPTNTNDESAQGNLRMYMGINEDDDFRFSLYDKNERQTFYFDDDGDLKLVGSFETSKKNSGSISIDGGIVTTRNSSGDLNGISLIPRSGIAALYYYGRLLLNMVYNDAMFKISRDSSGEDEVLVIRNGNGYHDAVMVGQWMVDGTLKAKNSRSLTNIGNNDYVTKSEVLNMIGGIQ